MEGLDPELAAAIDGAAKWAVGRWRDGLFDTEDLRSALWIWYRERPSVQARFAAMDIESARRRLFYRAALQILSADRLQTNTFRGLGLYSVEALRGALLGVSDNKYLRQLLPVALEDLGQQNAGYREAIRSRYEDGVVPQDKAAERRLYHAMTALLGHVNVEYIAAKKGPDLQSGWADVSGVGSLSWTHRANPNARRPRGGYSDPTADLALGLIKAGDTPIELQDGSTTTYREEIMLEGFDQTVDRRVTDGQANPAAMPEGVFDPGFIGQDRADMYRAQVFPELYPDEEEMLIDNWPAQDREEYCGGRFTPGYRRFTVVR